MTSWIIIRRKTKGYQVSDIWRSGRVLVSRTFDVKQAFDVQLALCQLECMFQILFSIIAVVDQLIVVEKMRSVFVYECIECKTIAPTLRKVFDVNAFVTWRKSSNKIGFFDWSLDRAYWSRVFTLWLTSGTMQEASFPDSWSVCRLQPTSKRRALASAVLYTILNQVWASDFLQLYH